MAVLAFCNNSNKIWQIDTASTLSPVLRHDGQGSIHSLAPHQPGEFTMAWGGAPRYIRQTQGGTDVPVYNHTTTMRKVRVRDVGGQERIYFSTAEGPNILQNITIYYLQGQSTVLYYRINLEDLKLPNPCTGEEDLFYYTGDFVFGFGDTMYLSTGNLSSVAGIFEVSGAGPDGVTGGVTKIHERSGPIEGLCFVAPNTLFFLHSSQVHSFDLTTMTDNLEYSITGTARATDLVQAPAGSQSVYVFGVLFAVFLGFWESVYVGPRNLAWGRGWNIRDERDDDVLGVIRREDGDS
ncbi:MAG: hypothetical protein GY947_16565 [Rhodobacteraceae bacterium]|nr:hypothetical protein [Paracoccaceae bacterium]